MRQQVNIWLKRWNKEGLNGLIPKYDGGKPPKLSEEDYKILDEILEKTPNLTADIVSDILKSEFGVVFSDRHISRILKKLNYTYTKPFMIYSKMPDDAEDQLKKKLRIIDSDEDIIGFNDESRFNNIHNSGKIWHKKRPKKHYY